MANPEERVPIDSARVASTYPDKQALMNSSVKWSFYADAKEFMRERGVCVCVQHTGANVNFIYFTSASD